MRELKNKFGEVIPPRPEADRNTIARGVEMYFFRVPVGAFEEDKKESLISALNEYWRPYCDAYTLGKELENTDIDYFHINKQAIDELEQIDDWILEVLLTDRWQWFETHNPVPPFKVGDVIHAGKITGISNSLFHPGHYDVLQNGRPHDFKGRLLIAFEDAKEAKQ